MSDTPPERRRRAKAAAPPTPPPPVESDRDSDDDVSSDPKPRSAAPSGGGSSFFRSSAVWPLVAGLAIGFAAGREAYRFGLSDTRTADHANGASTAFIAAENAVKAYARMADFPAGWAKDSDIGNGATLFAGLTDPQKVVVMQALNERNCECGCSFGTLAHCLQKDPGCPRSPMLAKLAVDLVKQGKGLGEILSAIDAKQKDMAGGAAPKPAAAPEPPSTPRKVELAAWNPRRGPRAAKVTLVEFSDFQ